MLRSLQEVLAEHIRSQWFLYLLVVLIFTAGVVAGALSIRLLDEVESRELNEYFYSFVEYLAGQQPMSQSLILQRSVLQNGTFILVLWLCGVVFFGFVLAFGVILYRGFTIGFTVGFMAEQNTVQGILFAVGAVLPQNLLFVPLTVMAGVLSVSFSLVLLRRRMTRKQIPLGPYFSQYSLAMLVVALAFTLGSLVEAIITPVFMKAVVSLL
ncbi:MAG: stage II sporulation protein M [Dethiobacter sp.]|nr:stage II sporulation protein M [Dethiobacter sp.]MBS3983391.1 stage II sporulation protein M [Dethiobacter sp.]MCL5994114.1 stage II sporulation protein M [Bacillota bacterium]